jgi:outer membrane protein
MEKESTMKAIKTLAAALMLLPGLVWAEAKIAVLDMEAALSASKQAQVLRDKLQQEFTAEQEELRKLSDEGNALKDKLEKQGSFMSEDERKQLMAEIQLKYQQFQGLGNKVKKEGQARERQFLEELRPELEKVLKQIVEAEDIDVILHKKSIIYAEPNIDLTARIVEELNKL